MAVTTVTTCGETARRERRGIGSASQGMLIRRLLAVVSGVLLASVFPKFSLWFLAWVALVPLLVSLVSSETYRASFGNGLLAGLFYFGIVLYWIPRVLVAYGGLHVMLAVVVYLILVLYVALFIGGFALVLSVLIRRFGEEALLLAPALWVSFELGRNYLVINGFPWDLLGYSQIRCLPLVQVADVTGVYGISFLVVAVNAALAYCLMSRTPGRRGVTLACAALLVVLTLTYGYKKSFESYEAGSQSKIKVACVQADIPVVYDRAAYAKKFFVDYPRLIRATAPFAARLIVLPESPTPFSFQQDDPYRTHMIDLARKANAWLLFNDISMEAGDRYFNSACLLGPSGELVSRYDKMHLVPFGEYVPMRNLLFFAGKLLKEVSDFSRGSDFVINDLGGAKFATFICFEAIFPELVRQLPRRGAEFLINITNDSWYGDTAAPYQHFDMAVLRAIENRRYFIRAANSGISAIVDPYGRVLARSKLFKEAVLDGEIIPRRELTFYTRFGDVFAWICVIISLGVLVAIKRQETRDKRQEIRDQRQEARGKK